GEAMAPASDRQRGEGRAEQCRRADEPDLELPEPEREQVRRQHHGDEAVGERAQRPGGKDAIDHVCIRSGAPIAFHAEWPPSMKRASNPASRSAMAVLQPTWKP